MPEKELLSKRGDHTEGQRTSPEKNDAGAAFEERKICRQQPNEMQLLVATELKVGSHRRRGPRRRLVASKR